MLYRCIAAIVILIIYMCLGINYVYYYIFTMTIFLWSGLY
jgi:hypothetical protein